MAIKYTCKPVTHYEQMHNPNLKRKVKIERLERSVLTKEKVLDEDTGRVFYRSSYVLKDNNKELSKYRVSDFSLENLISIGAVENLRKVHLNNGNFENIESLERSAVAIEKSMSNTSNNN